jgi:hypothetical protein
VRNISLTNIVKIAVALGVPASEVLALAETNLDSPKRSQRRP